MPFCAWTIWGALKKEIFQPNGYAVYEQQNAIYQNLRFRYYIDEEKFNELRRFAVQPGDVIVSCSGTIGKTFVIPKNAPEGIINQALLKLTYFIFNFSLKIQFRKL